MTNAHDYQVELRASTPGRMVPSVARAAAILDLLATTRATMTLTDLSRQLEIPKSTALGVCSTLVAVRLLERSPEGTYRLGPHLVDLSRAYLAQLDLPTEFARYAAEADVLPQETLVLSVLDGTEVVYVASRPGLSPLAVGYRVGLRLPAHCTASGKALLSLIDERALTSRYRGQRLATLTEHSISSLAQLRRALAETRERGYAIDDEETSAGMICLGIPVDTERGAGTAAVAVSLVKGAADDPTRAGAVAELRRLADLLSARFGAPARS